MKKVFSLLPILLILVSCSGSPSPVPPETQSYVSVLNNQQYGDVWVQIWADTESRPLEYSLVLANKEIREPIEKGTRCHISIRIVAEIAAREENGEMEKIYRISESKDFEFVMEHRISSISIYKDNDGYLFVLKNTD